MSSHMHIYIELTIEFLFKKKSLLKHASAYTLINTIFTDFISPPQKLKWCNHHYPVAKMIWSQTPLIMFIIRLLYRAFILSQKQQNEAQITFIIPSVDLSVCLCIRVILFPCNFQTNTPFTVETQFVIFTNVTAKSQQLCLPFSMQHCLLCLRLRS